MGWPYDDSGIENPYNTSGLMEELMNQSDVRIDGLNAEKANLQSEYSDITQNTFGEGAGAYGSILLPFLAGYFGAGRGGDGVAAGAVAAGKAGQTYFNNLDADEKARKALNLGEQQRVEKEIQDQVNFSQQLTGYGVGANRELEQSYLTGRIPNTPPYQQVQQDTENLYRKRGEVQIEVDREKAENRARLAVAKAEKEGKMIPVSEVADKYRGMNLTPPATEFISIQQYKADIDAARAGVSVKGENRRQDQYEYDKAKTGVVDLINVAGRPLDKETSNTIMKEKAGLAETIRGMDALDDVIKRTGTLSPFGNDSRMQGAIQALLTNVGRLRTGSGASFTDTEQQLITALNEATVGGGRPVEAFLNSIRGIDPLESSKAIKNLLKKSFQARVLEFGFIDPMGEYDEETLAKKGQNYVDAWRANRGKPTGGSSAGSYSTSGGVGGEGSSAKEDLKNFLKGLRGN